MSKYDDILEELKQEFSRIGSITIYDTAHQPGKEGGMILAKYCDMMIERAAIQLYDSQKDMEFAKAVKLFMAELADKHITLTITKG